jgi:hypothetical protein
VGNPEVSKIDGDISRCHPLGILGGEVGTGGDGRLDSRHVIDFNSVEQGLVRALRQKRPGQAKPEQQNEQSQRCETLSYRDACP